MLKDAIPTMGDVPSPPLSPSSRFHSGNHGDEESDGKFFKAEREAERFPERSEEQPGNRPMVVPAEHGEVGGTR